jgi:stress-induced-phosphoprotein 1
MNRISDAIEAYKEGLKHEPENQQLKNDLKSAEDKQMQSQQGLLQAYLKLANNPETKEYLSDPQFMQKVQAIMQNPQLFAMFQNDPKIKKAYDVINEGGMPGNFNFEEFMKNM